MESPVTSLVWSAVVLHPADDVAVALRPLEPGLISLRSGDAKTFEVRAAIPLGHKFALRDIPVGADVRKTREVRESDSKGRHTTTHRELVMLPGGGLMIDTPGMRELQLWDASESVRDTFDDIEALAGECHFTDCRHRDEPRCAVKAAVDEGRIPPDRLASYLQLQDELAFLARQQDERAQIEHKRRGKIGAKALRQHLKSKRI